MWKDLIGADLYYPYFGYIILRENIIIEYIICNSLSVQPKQQTANRLSLF